MKLNLKVAYNDGSSEEVTVGPVSQVAFEREHNIGIGVLAKDQKMGHLYWLAWHASTKGQGSFDDWLRELDSVEDATAEKAAPFDEAPSDAG